MARFSPEFRFPQWFALTRDSSRHRNAHRTRTMKTGNRRINPFAVTLATLGFGLMAIQQVQGAGFVSVRPMIKPRWAHSATLLPNGKVLVAGGGGAETSAELYDPATDTWTVTGVLRANRIQHTATLLPNGKVLVAGGGWGSATASAELYDPATGAWTLTGAMQTPRTEHTATLLPNGKVLVARGGPSELYDPATGTWTATGGGGATLLPNGKVLAVGFGATLYDPTTGTSTATGAPGAVGYHTATLLLNGKVLVAGSSYGLIIYTAELYDPDSGTWSTTGSLAWDRGYDSTATLLRNGQVLVVGGHSNDANRNIPSAELYDPTSGTWTEIAMRAMSGRVNHTATLLPNGKVLVVGGSFAPGSAELYEPDSDGAAPSITILHGSKDIMSFSWNGLGTLEEGDSLAAPNWQPAMIQDNPLIVGMTGPRKFFRLRFNQ
jgi:hypothetical protein